LVATGIQHVQMVFQGGGVVQDLKLVEDETGIGWGMRWRG
jgi:hypothetical protein